MRLKAGRRERRGEERSGVNDYDFWPLASEACKVRILVLLIFFAHNLSIHRVRLDIKFA